MVDDASGRLIAVVDDDVRILQSLEAFLESAGFTVRLCASALALLECDDLEAVDCVISDIDMPAIDGLELSRVLHVVRPDLPIIFITGHPELMDRAPPDEGMIRHGLFTKPYDPHELARAIADSLPMHRRGGP